jgi:hypothetical protein
MISVSRLYPQTPQFEPVASDNFACNPALKKMSLKVLSHVVRSCCFLIQDRNHFVRSLIIKVGLTPLTAIAQ